MLRRLAPAGLRAATAELHGTPVPMEPALVGAAQCWRAAAPTAAPLHTAAAALASVQVTIPALGESISDGTVAAVLKQVGDLVAEDEAIVQIETDKVTVDVRSPRAGVVLAVLVSERERRPPLHPLPPTSAPLCAHMRALRRPDGTVWY